MILGTIASPVLPLAFFDMLGGSELLVIFLLVLIFFGGEKMPEFARGLGKAIREFRKAASGVEQEFKRALEDEPQRPTPPPATYPAASPNTILPPAPGSPPQQHNIATASAATPPVSPVQPSPSTPPAPASDSHHPDLPDEHHAG